MFTDASDHAAAAVLTQENADNDGKVKEMPTSLLSFLTPNISGAQWSKRAILSIMQ